MKMKRKRILKAIEKFLLSVLARLLAGGAKFRWG